MKRERERKEKGEDSTSKPWILAIEFRESSGAITSLMPYVVGNRSNPELDDLVNGAIQKNSQRLDELLSSKDRDIKRAKHGRKGAVNRPSRQLRDLESEQRIQQIESNIRTLGPLYQQRLEILKGETLGKVTVDQDAKGNFTGISVTTMSESEKEKEIWPLINEASKVTGNREALSFVVEAYQLREDVLLGRGNGNNTQDFESRYREFVNVHDELAGSPFTRAVLAIKPKT